MDPIALSSGLLTLATFALQSSKALYDLVNSFQNHSRNVRQLTEELDALSVVLKSLYESVDQNGLDVSALEIPLRRCGMACQEFSEIVNKCTSRSKGPKTSFRDWFKISYLGKDIAGFTGLIAGYKSTITIALGDANIRTTKVTANLLREYKMMVTNTTSDLEANLHDLDARMHNSTSADLDSPEHTSGGELAAEEERESILQCLKICLRVSTHIDEVQSQIHVDAPLSSNEDKPEKLDLARLITNEALADCKRGLGFTSVELKARLRDAERRITSLLRHEQWSEREAQDRDLLREELDSVKQCLSICAGAAEEVAKDRVNIFEDVSMTDDGQQIIVSTIGDLISAKRVTTGSRSTQWMGQMSDATIQRLSQTRSEADGVQNEQTQVVRGTRFENRHGTGKKLA